MKDPIIILIGGASGTSKTTNGKNICNAFNINHRMGSGFVREIVKNYISRDQNPYLYNFSFSPHDDTSPYDNLYKQSEVIKKSIELCIARAFREGTSLLIEGVNIIPGLIDTKNVLLNILFTVDDYNKHLEMIRGKTHFKREISIEQFNKVREIQNNFKIVARQHGWDIIDLSTEIDIIKELKKII